MNLLLNENKQNEVKTMHNASIEQIFEAYQESLKEFQEDFLKNSVPEALQEPVNEFFIREQEDLTEYRKDLASLQYDAN